MQWHGILKCCGTNCDDTRTTGKEQDMETLLHLVRQPQRMHKHLGFEVDEVGNCADPHCHLQGSHLETGDGW